MSKKGNNIFPVGSREAREAMTTPGPVYMVALPSERNADDEYGCEDERAEPMSKLDTAKKVLELVEERDRRGWPLINRLVDAYKRWRTDRAKRKARK